MTLIATPDSSENHNHWVWNKLGAILMVRRVWVPSAETEGKKFVLFRLLRRGSSYPKRPEIMGGGGGEPGIKPCFEGKRSVSADPFMATRTL